ncbi:succinate dehydrogenase, hydrophobic membrane anchor protein [Ignatzschineria ureiclastica]|uniref:Succinate dehydrogenase hydrophobic membrane anchor subunit n=2 Tax=Ignatzschineria TaxID=112008 RepID=A0A2U2ADS8_9GAMM|nr:MULTISPECIES: succinate dehydrogenase, hydrophobic membrane anchor protein [Ignatzschineria]PWD80810.1 succinate dehydrogenase, hydrophobic membrane anchor protein [Ignatzschineria ureiclastica]GGZ94547.1 succinate dehydrogenase membrane anchor subunit [Ignatzschineria ureiclastica]
MKRYQTPLGRVKGLGSAHAGSSHWLAQRVTAAVLAVLFLWFAFSFASLYGKEYLEVMVWVGTPFNTVLLVTLIVTAIYHAILGLQVVIEDYVHKACQRTILINAMRVILSIIGLAIVWAIIRVGLVVSTMMIH